METFDLGRLTDFDFEAVCKDLFELEFGVRLEIFTPGPDGGVDLRHLKGEDPALVVQCKHFHRSGRAKLLNHLQKVEAPKLRKLRPGRYVLATSVELSRDSKDKLYEALKPFVQSPSDIYGKDEIDALLRKHEQVVKRHLRLWLTSASVLNSLLSKSIVTRSQDLADRVDETLRTYADNGSRDAALNLLEDRHVCVVAGAPGVGKTTLSHVLCAHYLSHGYELVEISEDVEEANALWNAGVPQLFYYDDFLGQTAIDEKLGKNEDGRLISLMQRVARTPNKRFLLTTREYILAQAKQRYERLDRHRFDIQTCVLDVADYTYSARASILYNHVSASGLPSRTKSVFASPTVYKRIVLHANFNPRVIAATLAEAELLGIATNRIAAEMVANLEDPSRVWGHIVNYQISASDTQLLKALLSFIAGVSMDGLQQVWVTSGDSLRDLRNSLKVLDGTMIRTVQRGAVIFVEFHNPSVRDYMRDFISSDSVDMKDFVDRIQLFEQVESLYSMLSSRNSEQVLQALKTCIPDLVRAAEGAFRAGTVVTSQAHYYADDKAHRALVYMKLGAAVGSDHIHDIGWRSISDDSVIGESWSQDAIEGVLAYLSKSKKKEIIEFLPAAIEQAVDWIMESDLSGWRHLTDALEFVAKLADLGDAGDALETIYGYMDDYAERALESWSERGVGSHYSLSEMQDIFHYYEDGEGDRNQFDEDVYDLARAHVEAADSSKDSSTERSIPRITQRANPEKSELDDVARMMATLVPRNK
ncbi:restriction endonuclease [Streptomyces sp. NPDC057101]|uniref:nSTAND3 domain-containing NTPase n=1 Tax=Streptomyces sp. NPDC057101 TaxID=3346020 RepID=UPI00362EBDB1